jgi:ferredoxin
MRVEVNLDSCCGHGVCVDAAPEVFEMRDDDKAHVILEHPDEELRAKVQEAVRVCPQMAIDLFEDGA